MARAPRIALIGGGIGGLTAAHALLRRGFEVSVHEAAPELREIGAGVALGANSMKDMGKVMKATQAALSEKNADGKTVSEIVKAKLGG